MRVMAMIHGGDSFLSNQFLPGLGGTASNLGYSKFNAQIYGDASYLQAFVPTNSTNGTTLNGRPILSVQLLKKRDKIKIGQQVQGLLAQRRQQVSARAGMVAALGFRIEEPYVLMSARPFGNWGNYLPSNPGFP